MVRSRHWTTHVTTALVFLVLLAVLMLPVFGQGQSQQIHRNNFEGRETCWIKGTADAPVKETAHELSDRAHNGQKSEFIQLQAERGNYIYYYYNVGKAPLTEELNVSLWLKGNRPGMKLMARVVLPHERNGDRIDEPLTVMIAGEPYTQAGSWKRLEIRNAVKLARDQQQLLRVRFQRDINLADAYVDQLILNLYGGPGLAEVWIDDLEIGPVAETTPFQTASRPKERAEAGAPVSTGRAALVELDRNKLLVEGKRFVFRLIRHSDTPLAVLKNAGFNAICFDPAVNPAQIDEAINQGFLIVPSLPVSSANQAPGAGDMLGKEMSRYLEREGVLFWYLGDGGLAAEQEPDVAKTARLVRSLDPRRPLAADVWDGFVPFSQSVDLLGVHRWPLMTGLELSRYREWLNQRRLLANPDTFMWTWVQTHLPDWYTNLVYDQPGNVSFNEPIGPLPEQIRLLTYIALSAGCRGIGFWSDRFLADSHQGRDRLLALAILNQELQLLDRIFVEVVQSPVWIDSSNIDVRGVVFYSKAGVMVLPMWMGKGSQFVPGQAAATRLTMIVPNVPIGSQAYEVSPAAVKSLPTERVVGGTKITLPEFGLTSAIVFTTDNGPTGLLVQFQEQTQRMRKVAAQWAHDLAAIEIDKVTLIHQQLEQAGHTLPDGKALLENARARLEASGRHLTAGDAPEAYNEAQRALRPVRILMRAHWEQATKNLSAPVSSPYAVSFFTLVKHWALMDKLAHASAGANALPGGDFETEPDSTPAAWVPQQVTLDKVEMIARRVNEDPRSGKQCLMLQIKPKDPKDVPRALERTFLALHSPAVRLQPGSLVRISGWVKMPADIAASADGALLYDSAGGEPLAIRLNDKVPKWKQFFLYRFVPPTGTVNVTLALTGFGTVYFDDIRIEPMYANSNPTFVPELPNQHGLR